jgi:fumarylacetoacetase
MNALNETYNPVLCNWVTLANQPNCDFPIQDLSFGTFPHRTVSDMRVGVVLTSGGFLDLASRFSL